jgi:predicted HAD superfamily phosphohydrolase
MGATLVDAEFSKYWSQLTSVQKQSLLSVIKSFVETGERVSNIQYNQELQEAEEQYEAGDYITQEEMLKLIRQW